MFKRSGFITALSGVILMVSQSHILALDNKHTKEESLMVDGVERTYILHLPADYAEKKSIPLVFVFHGGGGSAQGARRMSQMDVKADKENFIVVYPNGTGKYKTWGLTWNTWNCCGAALDNNVDDVQFIRKLIEFLSTRYNIDHKRIYATGMSNGGMMSYRLACELSDKIAAVAPVAGSLNYDDPRPSFPVSVIAFHGTADEHLPYYGGKGRRIILSQKERIDKPVSYAISFWVKYNGCSSLPQKEEFGNIIREKYTDGRLGSEVVLYTIKGGGHSWPGGKKGAFFGNVDPPTSEISATDLIWDFFAAHPKQ